MIGVACQPIGLHRSSRWDMHASGVLKPKDIVPTALLENRLLCDERWLVVIVFKCPGHVLVASMQQSRAVKISTLLKSTIHRQEEADRELTYVRDAIRQTSARRASLLDVCATLDVPFAPPPTHHQLARAPLHRPNRGIAGSAGATGQHAEQSPADGQAAPSSSPSANSDVCSAALALGPPSGGGLASAAADMEWRATRLECLMYRVLWVSEAVKMFQPQYSPRQSTHHYDLFIRATHWAKQLSEEYEESIRAYCCELERLRSRLRDVAAVDLGYEIGAAALEVVRRCVGHDMEIRRPPCMGP